MNLRLLGVFALGALLAACSDETPQTAEVVYQDKGSCNIEGSVADFKNCKKDQVFFDFDKSKILDEEQKVPAMKEFLCKYNKKGSIVGHCDIRGSSEYNFALGQRRANALSKALKSQGLPSSSICGVYSVGKERPLMAGNSEQCHALNRTSIFVLSDSEGGIAPSAPSPVGSDAMIPPKIEAAPGETPEDAANESED
ncbi:MULTISPECIES: OmpA family protein [Holospora]|uniref:Outer membrane lipoprotein Omp16 n=2 Tax=Holospora TaxID=44747 RepID=A0A061JHQ6_9PROT|nr:MULTISPECIES: OmpA family protein [Holospora]ETZ04997.1 outer membrane lipoprotein Omp16 [Holospora undulata HU1]GAJ46767.1 outer membrane lipoprotein Omp16 [Holospora elegans E1]